MNEKKYSKSITLMGYTLFLAAVALPFLGYKAAGAWGAVVGVILSLATAVVAVGMVFAGEEQKRLVEKAQKAEKDSCKKWHLS